ncbi:hypothetical protein BN946_scf184414.g6 [Trametes cinnabarina]|uniref:Uncharacterized protein n=1 Tax=Pycnoporus cinnabarinus TaxID=5643 RepID=A0A060SVW6_PYCCI|nr:hypothetical protein BN946_scf184414.g6 [Trametes cinnabarina]
MAALEDMEALASQLAKELSEASPDGKPNEQTAMLLQRIGDEVKWSYALSETKGGKALLLAMRAYGTAVCRAGDKAHTAAYMRVANPIQEQIQADHIRTVAQRWSVLAKGGAAEEVDVPSSTADNAVPEEKPREVLSYSAWNERTKKWIAALNDAKNAPVVEVGPDGTFVGGDLGTSKGDEDEFEAEVSGAKPGVWLMSLESADQQAADEAADDEDDLNRPKLLRFVWTGEGQVDYDALPSRADVRVPPPSEPDAEWETVGSFSVDSGMVCLFSKAALDALLATGPPEEREAMLESFIDDDHEGHVFVPSGMLISGNDGAYDIWGRYDGEGNLVELKVQESYF